MKYFLDTNFIFALHNESDSLNLRAREMLEFIGNNELITSTAIIAELICSGEKKNFVKIVNDLNCEIIDISLDVVEKIPKVIGTQSRRKLKAIDCIILSQCLINKFYLITFDTDLQKVYERLIEKPAKSRLVSK